MNILNVKEKKIKDQKSNIKKLIIPPPQPPVPQIVKGKRGQVYGNGKRFDFGGKHTMKYRDDVV